MQEIELKFLEINKEALVKKLTVKKAKKTFEGLMKVAYFDQADGRIKKADELFRLRDIGNGQVEITYKANPRIKDGCKVYDESEVLSENFELLCQILIKAGLKRTIYYEKKRLQYEYDGVKFEIDEHPRIPVFVELEIKNSQKLDQIIKEFDLGEYETSNLSIAKLVATKYKKVKLNGLKFNKKIAKTNF